jgi:hypothetical protein
MVFNAPFNNISVSLKKTKEVPLSQTVSENIHKLRKVIKSDERITLKKYRNAKRKDNIYEYVFFQTPDALS